MAENAHCAFLTPWFVGNQADSGQPAREGTGGNGVRSLSCSISILHNLPQPVVLVTCLRLKENFIFCRSLCAGEHRGEGGDNYICDNGQMPLTWPTELLKLNNNKTSHSIKRWVKVWNRHLSKDKQMAIKHMKRCSPLLIIREKTNWNHRHHFIPVSMAMIR